MQEGARQRRFTPLTYSALLLPALGALLAAVGRPIVWLAPVTPVHAFVAGWVLAALAVAVQMARRGSLAAWCTEAGLRPQPVAAALLVLLFSAAWGGTAAAALALSANLAPGDPAAVPATLADTRPPSRGCAREGIFLVGANPVPVCVPVARTTSRPRVPAPLGLQAGQAVLLHGTRNAFGFIVTGIAPAR